jgi:trehalose 6-phosphate synthase/phosphatase
MPGVVVAVISGRDRESLDGWLGHLPVRLVAEHGYWVRGSAPGSWAPTLTAEVAFRGPARAVMDEATAHAPGSFVEEKSAGVAWHWRLAEPVRGGAIAGELARRLRERVGGQPVDVLEGDKVVEVRLAGANKGAAVERLRREVAAGSLFVCAGNDRTDEDMFRAAPRGSVTIRVGGGESRARFRLAAPPELHAFLLLLAPAG